jgi:hypothetical protein
MTTARQRSATNPLHHNRAKAVQCPKCGAEAGVTCFIPLSTFRPVMQGFAWERKLKGVRPHVERVKLWEKRQDV